MILGRLDEHRPATLLALLQVAIIVAGTLLVFAVTKHWDEMFYRAIPWQFRFIRSAGLLLLVVPPAWLAATIIRSSRSRFRVEPAAWNLAGIAIFLLLVLLYSSAILLVFMPVITPIQSMD